MFKQNIALLSGGAIQSTLENILQLELLTKNYAVNVCGALCLQQDSTLQMSGNVSCIDNRAGQVGGAVAVINSPLWTVHDGSITLSHNTAKRGSAAFFRHVVAVEGEPLHDLYIAHNTATVGGTVFWVHDEVMQQEPVGMNTTSVIWDSNTAAQYGPKVATQAVTILGPTVYSVEVYDTALTPALVFTLRDYYDQDIPIQGPTLMRTVLESTDRSQCQGHTPALNGQQSVVLNRNATFSALEAECSPEGSINVRIEAVLVDLMAVDGGEVCNVDMDIYTIKHNVRLDFRECKRGEVLKDGRCVVCPLSTYSLEYPVTEDTVCADCSSRTGVVSCYGDVLEVSAGYWRRHETSHAVLDCLENVNGCQGGNSTGNALCEEGYEGPLCAVCADGYYTSNGLCQLCGEDGVPASPTVVTFLCIAAVLAALLAFFFYAKCMDDSSDVEASGDSSSISSSGSTSIQGRWSELYNTTRRAVNKKVSEMRGQIKILITTYQIVSTIPSNLSVDFPGPFASFINVFIVFNLNVTTIVPFDCEQRFTFIDKLVFTTLFPIALTALLLVLFLADSAWQLRHRSWINRDTETKRKLQVLKNKYLTYFFFLTYLVLPSVSTMIFQTFLCTNVDPRHEDSDPSDSYLIADMSISCTSEYYQRGFIYAILMMLGYVVGIPSMYFILLHRHRGELMHRDDELDTIETPSDHAQEVDKTHEDVHPTLSRALVVMSAHTARLSFLWDAYEPQYWYWEVVETTRRLMLTAVLSVCGAGTSAQSIFAVLLALLYSKLYGLYAPYVSDHDDVIAEVGQFQILFSFLGALIYQNSLLGEEWNTAVSIVLIALNACVGVVFTYYAFIDLAGQVKEYKGLQEGERQYSSKQGSDQGSAEGSNAGDRQSDPAIGRLELVDIAAILPITTTVQCDNIGSSGTEVTDSSIPNTPTLSGVNRNTADLHTEDPLQLYSIYHNSNNSSSSSSNSTDNNRNSFDQNYAIGLAKAYERL